MFEDIWYHALQFLENYKYDKDKFGPAELYKFADDTGILARHRQRMERPFTEKDIDIKVLYSELIKMLLDYEEKRFPDGFDETRDIHKIQGFQDLTNRLQYSLNIKYENNLANLNSQLNVMVKQHEQQQRRQEALEQKTEAQQRQIEFLLAKLGETNKDVLLSLEKRIDMTDQMVAHLKTHEAEQDRRLDGLETVLNPIRRKISEIENVSTAIQEDHIKLNAKVKNLEADQDRQDKNMHTLEAGIKAVRSDQTNFEGRTEERMAILLRNDKELEDKLSGLFADTMALKEELAGLRLRKFVRPEEFQEIIERYDAEFRRLEALAGRREDPTIHISAAITEHLTGLRGDMDAVQRRMREEMEELRIMIANGRADGDGKFNSIFGRLEVLDAELARMLKNQDLSKILAELDAYRREMESTKGGLGGLLAKLDGLERDIHENRGNIGVNRTTIRDTDERVLMLNRKVEVNEDKVEKGLKEVWIDQRRQDENMEGLRGDINATSRNLALLSAEVKNINVDAGLTQRMDNMQAELVRQAKVDLELRGRFDDVNERSLKNLEKIIILEEQNQIAKEQANYVEMINNKMVEIEKKQTTPNWDADIREQRGAIDILQDDMRKLLARIEGHEGEFVVLRKDLVGLDYLKDEVRNIWESQRRQDHDIGSFDDRLKRLVINENELRELRSSLQGLLSVHGRIEALTDGQSRLDKSVVDILRDIKRFDAIDGELNSLRVNIREVLALKVSLDSLLDQQRKTDGAFELLSADVKKRLHDMGMTLEEFEARRRKLEDRFGEDFVELRGLLEVIERRIAENRNGIKDLDEKFDLNFQKNLDIFIANFKGGDFKELMDLVENKLYEVDRQSQKNKGHVDKLRELNSKLMVEIPSQVNKELQVLRNELTNIDHLRISDVDVLRKSFKNIEEEFGGLKLNFNKMNVDVRNIEEKHIAAITEVKNTHISISDNRLEEIQRNIMVANEGLRGRVLALEDKSDELRKLTKKIESNFAATINETVQNIRVEIDAGGKDWRNDLVELRGSYASTQNELGNLRVDIRKLEGLLGDSDNLRLRLDQFVNLHSGNAARFDKIEEALDGTRKDFRRDMVVLRRDFEAGLADIRGHRDEVDGRVGGVYARLDALENEMKVTLRESAIRRILDELGEHGREIEQTKDGLGGMLAKLKKVENDISANRETLLGHKEDIGAFDGKLRMLRTLIEDFDGKFLKNESSIKDLWIDQKRQDEENNAVRGDIGTCRKELALLSAELRNLNVNAALAEKIDNIQAEVARQARVDLDLKGKLEDIDDRSLKNLEKIIMLEEQNQIAKEQANYVEMINTKMVEIEKKQTTPNWDADIKQQRSAIDILQDDMRRLLARIEGHDGDFVVVKKDLAGLDYLKDEARNIWESQRRQDHDISSLDDRLKRLAINESQLRELQGTLQGLLSVHSRLEAHDKSIADILKDLKRFDILDGELNNLRVSMRDLIALKVTIDALLDQQRKSDGAFELLSADVKKRLHDMGMTLEEFEARRRKLEDRFGEDFVELRGLLEVIERRIAENRNGIKDLDDKFDLNFQKNLDIFIANFKGGDFKELMDLVENKLYEVDRQSQKNKGHVDKLRELNSKLMVEIPSQVNKELQVLRSELTNFDNLRISDINVLRKSFKAIEEEFGGFRNHVDRLNVDIRNFEEKHLAEITNIKNTNITISDSRFTEIQQGFVTLSERLQGRIAALELGVDDLRKDSNKYELSLVSKMDESIKMLRVDLDGLGGRLRGNIDEIRGLTDGYYRDIANLKEGVKELNKKDGKVEKVLQSLHLESEDVKNKLEHWIRLHGDTALRLGKFDDLIAEIKADLRRDMGVMRKDLDVSILNLKGDVDGRLLALLARLDTVENDLRLTSSDKTVKQILADLALYARTLDETKDGLAGLLARLSALDQLISVNKEQIGRSFAENELCQARLTKAENNIRNLDQNVDNVQKITKDLLKDQKRQDDDLASIRAEYGRLAALDMDLRNIHEHMEVTRKKFNTLEHEVDRQAKVDMNLKERTDEVDDRSIKNLEKIILLEEQNHIHKEQANYVETINTKMVEIEKKQTAVDRWGEVDSHGASLLAIQDGLKKLIVRIDGHDVDLGQIRVDISSLEKLRGALGVLESGFVDLRQDVERNSRDVKQVDVRLVQESGDRVKADASLGQRLEEASTLLGRDITSLRGDFGEYKRNHWAIILQIYGALRRYSVVLKSRGEAREEIPYCMGVYRMVDFKHGKPVYKQDGGEHFLYFQRDVRGWMVGTKIGQKFGWVRNFSDEQQDSLLPDIRNGWRYQPLAREGRHELHWKADDPTLTVEALGDIDRISDLFRSFQGFVRPEVDV